VGFLLYREVKKANFSVLKLGIDQKSGKRRPPPFNLSPFPLCELPRPKGGAFCFIGKIEPNHQFPIGQCRLFRRNESKKTCDTLGECVLRGKTIIQTLNTSTI
jgi:hypothetical protein